MSAITKVIQILGREPNAGTGAEPHRFSFRDDGVYIDELHLRPRKKPPN